MENESKLSLVMVDDIIRLRITKKSFLEFLEENTEEYKYSKNSDKLTLVNDFLEEYSDNESSKEMASFEEFLVKRLVYGKSRIITESDIENIPKPIKSKSELLRKLNVSHLNFNKILRFTPTQQFKLIYRKVDSIGDDLKGIHLIYCRKYKDYTESDKYLRGEYVAINIDLVNYKLRMHLPSRQNNRINKQLSSKTPAIFNYFSKYLLKTYNITIGYGNNEQFIYNIYSYLTKQDERPYSDLVSNYENDIRDFSNKLLSELNIADLDDEDTIERLKGVFVRKIIRQDFDNFLNNPSVEGRVKAFIFGDPEGTRLKASKGTMGKSLVDNEVNIESSTAYFDNKETINAAQRLFSVYVVWKPGFGVFEDTINIRYTAYPQFLETQIIKEEVTEGLYNNVLQKAEQLRENI